MDTVYEQAEEEFSFYEQSVDTDYLFFFHVHVI